MKRAVQIGSGNIGRGLNAFVLNKNEYHVTFLDVATEVIDKINSVDSYVVNQIDGDANDTITNFNGVSITRDFGDAAKAISEAQVVLISIGISNLHFLDKLFAKAFELKMQAGDNTSLNVVAVENGLNATDVLKEAVLKVTSADVQEFIKGRVAFPNAAVDRIVPNQSNETLDVQVEEFYELVIQDEWLGDKLSNVNYSSSLQKFLERKLFMLNAVHAFIAWSGVKQGFTYIYEFTDNPQVKADMEKLLDEFVTILESKFDFTKEELVTYKKKIIKRLSNPVLKDDVTRVGRGVKRKVGAKDRFMIPINYAVENNLEKSILIKGLALAYSGLSFEDPELEEINNFIKSNSVEDAIIKFSGIESKDLLKEIINELN